MLLSDDMSTFQRKIAERRAAQGAREVKPTRQNAVPVESPYGDGPIPGLEDFMDEPVTPQKAAVNKVNEALDSIDVVEAYNYFIKKGTVTPRNGQTESIMCRCPNPGHEDKRPDAWMTTNKGPGGLWTCGPCNMTGGDKFDLAAIGYGYPYPQTYKSARVNDQSMFWELKRRMAKDLRGVDYDALVAPVLPVAPDAAVETAISIAPRPDTPDTPETPSDPAPVAHIVPIVAGEPTPQDVVEASSGKSGPTFDASVVLPGTTSFLRRYYDEGIKDDSPNEYQLWCGLAALSVTLGRNIQLADFRPITANLSICLTGPSTAGKSRALEHCSNMVLEVMPFSTDFPSSSVVYMKNPGSGEYLVKRHRHEIEDPTTFKGTGQFVPIKSLVEFDEMATFAGRSSQVGNSLKQFIMDLADGRKRIETGSLSNGTFVVEDAFSTIMTTTQPGSLKYIFNKGDAVSGLLNRFIFPQGTTKRKHAMGGVALDFTEATKALREIRTWAEKRHTFDDWEPAALELWESTYHNRIQPLQDRDESHLLGRLDLTMKRLILLFAANDMAEVIEHGHVIQAVALLPYLLACYSALDSELNTSADTDFMTKVLAKTKEFMSKRTDGLGPTTADLKRYIKGYDVEQWMRMLNNLEKMDLIVKLSTQAARGRPRVSYLITENGEAVLKS